MRIVFITLVTPTPDNCRGASALPYHLLKFRPANIDILCYTFNLNKIPELRRRRIADELVIDITVLKTSVLLRWMFYLRLGFLKMIFPYPFTYYNKLSKGVVGKIKKIQPDGIWIYGDGLSRVARQLKEYKRVMTMPDCVPLYYHRLLGDKYSFGNWLRMMGYCVQYKKNIQMEREYPTDTNITYHMVGEQDREFFKKILPQAHSVFIKHPHYNYNPNRVIRFTSPRIKILISGAYNLYTQTALDELLPLLCTHKELAKYYSIAFLGKGWDFAVERLCRAGYESKRLEYVDVYLDEISKYDIQIVPISVGTGTKGKVLDALANGLLVIGTPYALENIEVRHNQSCLMYNTAEQVVQFLNDIILDIPKYESIAEKGRECVILYHDRWTIALSLFDSFCD